MSNLERLQEQIADIIADRQARKRLEQHRPTKLAKRTVPLIVAYVRKRRRDTWREPSQEDVARHVGVSRATLHRWITAGWLEWPVR